MPERSGSESPPAAVPEILAACDRVLGEIGRREHRFSWLRDPNTDHATWLAVDAYYPARRLVVVCDSPDGPLLQEAIPAHGLRLLQLAPGELPADPRELRSLLTGRVAELGASAPPRRLIPPSEADRHPRPHSSPVASAVASLVQPVRTPTPAPRHLSSSRAAAAERAARLLEARREADGERRSRTGAPRRRPQPTRPPAAIVRRTRPAASSAAVLPPPSLLVGLALTVALCVEIYLAVALALSSGQVLLAAGLVLDACARTLGAIAAVRLGGQSWVWGCVLVGSPAVIAFTLLQDSGPVELEPAPLAGVLSLAALTLLAVGGLVWALGL